MMRQLHAARMLSLGLAATLAACGGSSIVGGSDSGTPNDAGTQNDAGTPGDAGSGNGTAVCGNGILESGETCDDGNTQSFDGCSATCQVEETQRVNWLQMQFAADSSCSPNALGGAVVQSTARTDLQTAITQGIGNGSITILMTLVNGYDPSGANASGLTVGVLAGAPEMPAGSPAYDGSSDLDWWYTADPSSVSAVGAPLATLSGSVSNGIFSAGPGSLSVDLSFGGGVASLSMSDAMVTAPLGAPSALISSTGLPPGHLASEHIDSSLEIFANAGTQTTTGSGALCGNVSAKSLSAALLPSAVTSVCTGFTASSSLLDLVVAGCKAYNIVQVVVATQPDQIDLTQTVAGAGGPYKLSASSGTVIDTCKDESGAPVDLATCLKAAAYSSYFRFAADRVILR